MALVDRPHDRPHDRSHGRPHEEDAPGQRRDVATRIALSIAVWSAAYAAYRAYYAFGGEVGMIGEPVSRSDFRMVNAVGALIILGAGVLALVAVRIRQVRGALPVLGWIGGVGCCMHALVDTTLRVLSLTGAHPTELPADFWLSFDRRSSDLQDLFLNEPWFLVEGLLWAALALVHVAPARRRAWLVSAVAACGALTIIGTLSGLDVIGSFVVA
jgi:hypothetical protein